MVLPLIIGGIVLASSALGLGTYFGLSNQAPDTTTTNQYSTTNQYQTKKTSLTLERGAKIGSITFDDTLRQNAKTQQSADQSSTSSLLSNPLVLAGGAVGVAYVLTHRGK